jgi:hypothetical protein
VGGEGIGRREEGGGRREEGGGCERMILVVFGVI